MEVWGDIQERIEYSYDADGIRNFKYVEGLAHQYLTLNGKVVRETIGIGSTAKVLDFIYDESGRPFALKYSTNGGSSFTTYYYVVNLMGDVVGLANSSGTLLVEYSYNAWGEPLAVTVHNSDYTDVANTNPLRYRGYYYDTETGWYYLQSRYYDPILHRFINADNADNAQFASVMMSESNLFAYCANNPVNRMDPNGDSWWGWIAAAAVVVVAAAAVVVTAGGAAGAMLAVTSVANGVAAATATSTVAAGAFVTASTYFTVSVASAASDSSTIEEFADKGTEAFINTLAGAAIGGAEAYSMTSPGSKSACFVAGTPVQTGEGSKPIEKVKAGDYVWAWDEETGETALKRVVETYVNEANELIHVFVNGGEIVATPEHPFYSPVKGWTAACKLRAGDILVTVNGEYVVVEKVQHELLESPINVYNFQVEDYHTYYVANSGVLVHNRCSFNTNDELSDSELRTFGQKGNNSGFRVTNGTSDEAMNFARSQTYGLSEYAPGKYVGYNSRGVEFRIYDKPKNNYTSIRISGIDGLKGIKFLWE